MITRLELKNFTAFEDLAIDFSPKINVIIGENGTGKTHLLKAVYALCGGGLNSQAFSSKSAFQSAFTTKILRLFMPLDAKLGKMHRQGAKEHACLNAQFASNHKTCVQFFNNSKHITVQEKLPLSQSGSVFIPTKEVLSLAKGMNRSDADSRTIQMIFDDSYIDLSKTLLRSAFDDPEEKMDLDPRFGDVVPKLVEIIGGKYQWVNGEFCFRAGHYGQKIDSNRSKSQIARMYQDSTLTHFIANKEPVYPISMTAEGFRKIGIIHRLLCNGGLNPGVSGPLLWDEPESNLNPKLMENLVKVLIALSRNGQQIILATHDYILLKWFDLLLDQGKEDHVRFHTLYRDSESGTLKLDSMDDYRSISPNAIAETFNDLTKTQVRLKMGDLGK